MQHEESRNFARDEVRKAVIPAYMGLIKQIDDHLGRLLAFLEERGLMDDTLIVVTSDHGDYLGDHWLGEKELFHEESVRIPLIVYDPDAAADTTRGTVDDRLVEAIDLAPTFVEAAGGDRAGPHPRGPFAAGADSRRSRRDWRDARVSECDYAFRKARQHARARTGRIPRLHAAHRSLEIHRIRRFPSATFRPGGRSAGTMRPWIGPRARGRAAASSTSVCSTGCETGRCGPPSPTKRSNSVPIRTSCAATSSAFGSRGRRAIRSSYRSVQKDTAVLVSDRSVGICRADATAIER